METTTSKTHCAICNKKKLTFKCEGCLKEFCSIHLKHHRQELNKELDEIVNNQDHFKQSLVRQIEKPNKHLFIQQINKWERNSIEKIRQTADEARQTLIKHTNEHFRNIEIKSNKLNDRLKQIREENDFNESILRQLETELDRLTKELTEPSHISIQEDSSLFISKISVQISESSIVESNIHHNTMWIQNGVTVAGGNGNGRELNQLSWPHGVYVEDDQSIYIADYKNHRVMKCKHGASSGEMVVGRYRRGKRRNQLNHPSNVIVDKEKNNLIICDFRNSRIVQWACQNGTNERIIISNINCGGVAIDDNGYLYISDMVKHEVRRWKMNGTCETLVAGGNGQGDDLNQLNTPSFIFVHKDHAVYVSDYNNHRVMKWMEGATEGIIVAGGQGKGNNLSQLSGPHGVIVDHWGSVYVADNENHRVMRWFKAATQGSVIVGGNEQGEQISQLNNPINLSFDQQRNLYVVDFSSHRVLRFDIDSNEN